MKERTGYFSGRFKKIKEEQDVFSGEKGFLVKGRGENEIFFREIEKD